MIVTVSSVITAKRRVLLTISRGEYKSLEENTRCTMRGSREAIIPSFEMTKSQTRNPLLRTEAIRERAFISHSTEKLGTSSGLSRRELRAREPFIDFRHKSAGLKI